MKIVGADHCPPSSNVIPRGRPKNVVPAGCRRGPIIAVEDGQDGPPIKSFGGDGVRRWLVMLLRTAVRPYSCIVILLLLSFAFAESPQELFKAGNALYADGKFSDAAQKYQLAADQGLRNWILEYNLGNAYYRVGQIGRAIVHYERAFRLNSGQRDVIYNLNLASTKAGDPVLPSSALPALGWRLFYVLSINTLTVIVSILFVLFCVAGGLLLYASLSSSSAPTWPAGRGIAEGSMDLRQRLSGITLWILLLGVCAGIWLGARIYFLEKPEGVVVSSVAEVRSGPNTTYPTSFTVPEGRRVLILQEQEPIQGWIEIGVPQEGLKGWVQESSVEVL
jgi:hypothetical protein